MTDLGHRVQNEGFCLLRLCNNLKEFTQTGQARKTYLYETEVFLNYITKCLEKTETFVRDVIGGDNNWEKIDEELLKIHLRDFGEIRTAFFWLYGLTKETIYADSLSIPFSLTTFLNLTAKKMEQQENVSLVVLGSSNLMYYKFNLKPLRDLTHYLATRIKDYPIFPVETGILMFPYCSAQEVLVNCILFHEMGHYIYERTGLREQFNENIEISLSEFVKTTKLMSELKAPLLAGKPLLNYVQHLILNWADEIFADIFAIRLLGPAYHLAYLEMEQILPVDIERNRKFSRTHPADDFRFKIHWKWLSFDWAEIIKQRTPSVFQHLKNCGNLNIEKKDFKIGCKPPLERNDKLEEKLHSWMLDEFKKMVSLIETKVSSKFDGFEKPIDDFAKNDALVTTFLKHGVVPSTVYDNGKKSHPSPTTLLNSGFFFYLSGMEPLLKKVKSEECYISKRIKYGHRLNQWLGKAIEDWQILPQKDRL